MPDRSSPALPVRSPIGLSAVVITKNEAINLAECLQSLAFCDETIVVDSGSTDATLDIARAFGARIIEREWPGFGPQKEFARLQAAGPWIVSLDADERVTPDLRQEILAAIADTGPTAYEMPRLSTFLGRPMRHSGWWPDYCLRLFRKDAARFSDDLVHERVIANPPVGRLKAHIDHHPIRQLGDALGKVDLYSSLGARKVIARGRKISFATPVLRGAFAFFGTYVIKAGFLDGREGFLNAVIHAQTVFWKYAKARIMQKPL